MSLLRTHKWLSISYRVKAPSHTLALGTAPAGSPWWLWPPLSFSPLFNPCNSSLLLLLPLKNLLYRYPLGSLHNFFESFAQISPSQLDPPWLPSFMLHLACTLPCTPTSQSFCVTLFLPFFHCTHHLCSLSLTCHFIVPPTRMWVPWGQRSLALLFTDMSQFPKQGQAHSIIQSIPVECWMLIFCTSYSVIYPKSLSHRQTWTGSYSQSH